MGTLVNFLNKIKRKNTSKCIKTGTEFVGKDEVGSSNLPISSKSSEFSGVRNFFCFGGNLNFGQCKIETILNNLYSA